jgi:hypothetical protein
MGVKTFQTKVVDNKETIQCPILHFFPNSCIFWDYETKRKLCYVISTIEPVLPFICSTCFTLFEGIRIRHMKTKFGSSNQVNAPEL